MFGKWLRKPTDAASVVFVHGILSSGETCWRHPNGTYWPELLEQEPTLTSLGIYVYTYQTAFNSGSYSLSNVVDDLKERFFKLDGIADSHKIVFICHSMGGIVVRKLIVEREADFLHKQIELGLYLVASPSLGSDYAKWLEPIARFAGHEQAKALKFSQNNQWLNDLDSAFINLKESNRLKISGKELLEDKFVTLKSFWRKQVVEPFSGARYFGESFKIADSDHFSIAKPLNNLSDQHRLLKAFILDMMPELKSAMHQQPATTKPAEPSKNHEISGTPQTQQVFISYRHVKPDEDLALALEAAFKQDGFQVFVDRRMQVGIEWASEIDKQLRNSQFFIILISADSILSDMVRQEIMLAHKLKQQEKLRILPVRINFTGALPYDLGGYLNPLQYALWVKGQPFTEIIENLRLAICNSGMLPFAGQAKGEVDSLTEVQELHDVTEKRGAPLPQIDPRVLELAMERGSMVCHSPFYIRRMVDDDIETILKRRGTTTTIKGARQMGKSSLLVRAAEHAKKQGHGVCYIDFQGIDGTKLTDLNSLLLYLMHRLARDFNTDDKPGAYWNEFLGAKDSATDFIERAVLSDPQKQVVLILDEADRVFNYDYRNDFFILLRFWTNRRAGAVIWERFNLVIAHSTDPALWIDDINQSPFNVGYTFVLNEFDHIQVEELATRYRLSLTHIELSRLFDLIGGHPFLNRQALYFLASAKITLNELEDLSIRQDGPFGDHLKRLSGLLSSKESLRRAIFQILKRQSCEDEQSFQRLFAAGLVVGPSRSDVQLRCKLYVQYFGSNL